jgi:hypothetical protein
MLPLQGKNDACALPTKGISLVNHTTNPKPGPLKRPHSHLAGCEQFAMVPVEWLAHIPNLVMLRVFVALAAHAAPDGWCYPSVKRLATLSAITARSVPNALRKLEALGAIETVHQPGRRSRYRLLPPPKTVMNVCVHDPSIMSDEPARSGHPCTSSFMTPLNELVHDSIDQGNKSVDVTVARDDGKEDDDQANEAALAFAFRSRIATLLGRDAPDVV